MQDITYIWASEGWLYLAIVIDLYSRKVVGWGMGSKMKALLVCVALTMAMWQRKPKSGLIVHSDQGVQYASHQYRRILRQNGFVGSMSKKGCCWDNAVAESFFGSLKQETRALAKLSNPLCRSARCAELHNDVVQQPKNALIS